MVKAKLFEQFTRKYLEHGVQAGKVFKETTNWESVVVAVVVVVVVVVVISRSSSSIIHIL